MPYHTKGLADGLAFSSGQPTFCPPSLKNILKEVEDDVYRGLSLERTSNYSLKSWATQGVLLLNTAFTVELANPNVHKALWTEFTLNIIKLLNARRDPIIFLLWGGQAKLFKAYINEEIHYVLESAHPSPLAGRAQNGFSGCGHFSKTNLILEEKLKKSPIEW